MMLMLMDDDDMAMEVQTNFYLSQYYTMTEQMPDFPEYCHFVTLNRLQTIANFWRFFIACSIFKLSTPDVPFFTNT